MAQRKTLNQLRIIGGSWRSRKVPFADVEGLRPTMDRVRETLFNWLGSYVPGSRCLDLFTGSGALGLEALSRGASNVVMVDNSRAVFHCINTNLATLKCTDGQVVQANANQWLEQNTHERFDIVFLDPPFNQNLLQPCIEQLTPLLNPGAHVYIEVEKHHPIIEVPASWTKLKEKKAGQLKFFLYEFDE
jgi:16S rRNA (guanine966-N2)-methyltransferase